MTHELETKVAVLYGSEAGDNEVEHEGRQLEVGVNVALVQESVPQQHELLLFAADLRSTLERVFCCNFIPLTSSKSLIMRSCSACNQLMSSSPLQSCSTCSCMMGSHDTASKYCRWLLPPLGSAAAAAFFLPLRPPGLAQWPRIHENRMEGS